MQPDLLVQVDLQEAVVLLDHQVLVDLVVQPGELGERVLRDQVDQLVLELREQLVLVVLPVRQGQQERELLALQGLPGQVVHLDLQDHLVPQVLPAQLGQQDPRVPVVLQAPRPF